MLAGQLAVAGLRTDRHAFLAALQHLLTLANAVDCMTHHLDQQQVTDALFLGNLDPRVSKRVLYDICQQVRYSGRKLLLQAKLIV